MKKDLRTRARRDHHHARKSPIDPRAREDTNAAGASGPELLLDHYESEAFDPVPLGTTVGMTPILQPNTGCYNYTAYTVGSAVSS